VGRKPSTSITMVRPPWAAALSLIEVWSFMACM
jgi:hypothetical protein